MRVTTLPKNRVAEACAVLGEAFQHEPVASRMVQPHLTKRASRLATYFHWSILYMGVENVDIAVDEQSNRILAAAIWQPPAHVPHKIRAALAMPAVYAAIGRSGMRVLNDFEQSVEGAHPNEPHWALVDIGASDAARGTGAGSALLRHRLRVCDEMGLPASLEATTDRSAALYERFGFVKGAQLFGAAEGSVLMVRPPQQIDPGQ